MVTWKYKFLIVSLRMLSFGTGINSPAIILYRTKIIPRIFHHFNCIEVGFFNHAKGTEIIGKRVKW